MLYFHREKTFTTFSPAMHRLIDQPDVPLAVGGSNSLELLTTEGRDTSDVAARADNKEISIERETNKLGNCSRMMATSLPIAINNSSTEREPRCMVNGSNCLFTTNEHVSCTSLKTSTARLPCYCTGELSSMEVAR